MSEIDYTGFGSRGQDFQNLHDDTWLRAEQLWDEHPRIIELAGLRVSRPPLADVLPLFDRSQFLLATLRGASAILGTMSQQESNQVWEDLRLRFFPPLRSVADLTGNQRNLVLLQTLIVGTLIPAGKEQNILDRRWELNKVSHGPFAAHEMSYLLENYPRLIEVSCGSGYLAYELFRRGADIRAQDNNKYGVSEGEALWTKRMTKAGRLVITDDAQSFVKANAGRALLVSWPEPGARYLPAVMEAYAAAGGQTLILKFGGYVGSGFTVQTPGYRPPDNIQEHYRWFFKLLTQDWEQVPQHPAWIPAMFYNNMFVFRRRAA